jgi:hypothetical protein
MPPNNFSVIRYLTRLFVEIFFHDSVIITQHCFECVSQMCKHFIETQLYLTFQLETADGHQVDKICLWRVVRKSVLVKHECFVPGKQCI